MSSVGDEEAALGLSRPFAPQDRAERRDMYLRKGKVGPLSGKESMERCLPLYSRYLRLSGLRSTGRWRDARFFFVVLAGPVAYAATADEVWRKAMGLSFYFVLGMIILGVNGAAKGISVRYFVYPSHARGFARGHDAFEGLTDRSSVLLNRFANGVWLQYYFIVLSAVGLGGVLGPAAVWPGVFAGREVVVAAHICGAFVCTFFWWGATGTFFAACLAVMLRFRDLRRRLRAKIEELEPDRAHRKMLTFARWTRAREELRDVDCDAVEKTSSSAGPRPNQTTEFETTAATAVAAKQHQEATHAKALESIEAFADEFISLHMLLHDSVHSLSSCWTFYFAVAEFFILLCAFIWLVMIILSHSADPHYTGPVSAPYRLAVAVVWEGIVVFFIPAIAGFPAGVTFYANSVGKDLTIAVVEQAEGFRRIKEYLDERDAGYYVMGNRISMTSLLNVFYVILTGGLGVFIFLMENCGDSLVCS